MASLIMFVLFLFQTPPLYQVNSFRIHAYTGALNEKMTVDETLCTTAACRMVADNIRLSMNVDSDPCEDFYEYACGMWQKKNPPPDDASRTAVFFELDEKIRNDLKQVLVNLNTTNYKEKSVGLVKMVYEKCLNESALDVEEVEPLKMEISDTFGPKIDSTDCVTFQSRASVYKNDLEQLLATLWFKVGFLLIDAKINADPLNTSFSIMIIEDGLLALGYSSQDYYTKSGERYESVREAYKTLIGQVSALLFNANSVYGPTEEQKKDAEDILKFEVELAKISVPISEKNPTKQRNKINLTELDRLGASLNLTTFVRALNYSADFVYVAEPEYVQRLNNLIAKTSADLLKGYLLWRLTFNRLPFLSTLYSQLYYDFMKTHMGLPKPTDRQMYCITYLIGETMDREFLGYAVGKLFVEHTNFTETTKEHVIEMIKEITDSFSRLLDANNWMDEKTKHKAKIKLNEMVPVVGFPSDIMNDLDSNYAQLLGTSSGSESTVLENADNFYSIHKKILYWLARKQLALVQKRRDRYMFGGSPAINNAWFWYGHNSIVFPAGILQSPYYNPSAPAAVNFGAIGTIMGHEITHGFDNIGSYYDERGNVMNWWSLSARETFQENTACLVEQYSKFCYPHLGDEMCVKGANTLGENIADNGGVKESFYAYKNYVKGKPDIYLPDFENFSMDQLFFLGFASCWCANFRDNALANQLASDEHSPCRDRVIGSLQNFDEFSKAFNCAPGTRMNPLKKCSIW